MNRVWTDEEIEILRRDREAKVPVPVTAAKLGRPVPATYARARLIGTLVQPHQPWDEGSVARLRALVSADPPMTDKRIAEELGRTVTQIRWKMQDLGLIGVRDLSKLAKATAAGIPRTKTQPKLQPVPKKDRPQERKAVGQKPAPEHPVALTAKPPAPVQQAPASPAQQDPRACVGAAVRDLENVLSAELKKRIAASEADFVQAAMDAIATKQQIDRHLMEMAKKAESETLRLSLARKAEAEARTRDREAARREEAAKAARNEAALREEAAPRKRETASRAVLKPAAVRAVLPAAANRPEPMVSRPVPAPAPKIVVVEAPAAARPAAPEPAPGQTSGRGGWKSVRRDPARIAAQSKAKATNRADAVDLSQAAQNAIERFIAERGVTRSEAGGIPSLVSRLQARGYIVVRDESGWLIDQRHRVDSEDALIAFAKARGITLNVAA